MNRAVFYGILRVFLVLLGLVSGEVAAQRTLDSNYQRSIKELAIIDTVYISFRPGELSQTSAYTGFSVKNPMNATNQRTVPEALTEIPGIQVQKTNHGGGSPYLRGMTGNQILTLVDGIRLNNSTFRYGPNQYINTVDGMALSGMDVVLGTGSVQYGSDAIGGAIMLYYRQPEFSESNNFKVSKVGGITRTMAPTMEGSQRLYVDAASKKVALTVGLTYRKFGDVISGGTNIKQTPTGYQELNGDAKLRMKAKYGEWQFAYQNNTQENVPVYHKVVLENFAVNSMDIQQRELLYARRIFTFTEKTMFKLTVGLQGSNEERSLKKNNSTSSTFENDVINTRFLLTEMNHRFKNHWILNTGYELYTDKVTSIRQKTDFTTGVISDLRGLYPNGSGLFQHGIYTMVKGEWNAAQITLGSRLQSTQTTIPDITLGRVRDNNRALVNTLGVSSALGKKGSNWGNNVRVYGNFSSTFRAPNIDDMGTLGIVDFRYEVPQFNLRPEYSNNHEIGLKLNANKLKFQVSYYQNYLYNVIARVRKGQDSINGYPVFQKENIERAIVQGLEIYTEISLGKSMFIKAGYATMRGDNLTKNEPMRRIPPSNGLVQWNYLWGKEKSNRVFVKYSAAAAQRKLASGDISDNRIGKNGTPGYLQLDIGIQFLWKDIRIATTMQNLSNEYIKVHGSGVAMPGRSINLIIEF